MVSSSSDLAYVVVESVPDQDMGEVLVECSGLRSVAVSGDLHSGAIDIVHVGAHDQGLASASSEIVLPLWKVFKTGDFVSEQSSRLSNSSKEV